MKLLLFWYFYTQQSVEFTQNGTKTVSCEWQFFRWKCLVDERDQRRMARLVRAVMKATVTRITLNNHRQQKSISE